MKEIEEEKVPEVREKSPERSLGMVDAVA